MRKSLSFSSIKWIEVGRFFLLLAVALLMLVPLLWTFVTSIKPEALTLTYPPRWIPEKITFENYREVWSRASLTADIVFSRCFFNSTFLAIVTVFLTLIVTSLAAYAFSRLRFPGRDFIFMVVLSTLIVPGEILLIPLFMLCYRLGWINSYNAVIFPGLGGAFGVFLLRQFFLTIPKELEEAARIDGCGSFRILITIILPLSKSALAALAIFTFLGSWNNFVWPFVVLLDGSKMTLPVALAQFINTGGNWSVYGKIMAAAGIASIPPILIFMFAQRQIISSIAITGLKG